MQICDLCGRGLKLYARLILICLHYKISYIRLTTHMTCDYMLYRKYFSQFFNYPASNFVIIKFPKPVGVHVSQIDNKIIENTKERYIHKNVM